MADYWERRGAALDRRVAEFLRRVGMNRAADWWLKPAANRIEQNSEGNET